ncbi:chloride channel protein [Epidermidibacterium keratini]|uniref:chloride channel protein n=1 Tax=Epidermidibacterium keratini TaxID=1891644 RepID=UPI0038513ED1
MKLLATAINLSSGWHGGEFFPLIIGGTVGLVVLQLVPKPTPERSSGHHPG